MSNQSFFVIKYLDRFNGGQDQKLEGIVTSHKQFIEWLKNSNEDRKDWSSPDDEFCPDTEEDFELIPLNLFS